MNEELTLLATALLALVLVRPVAGYLARLAAWIESGGAPPPPVATGREGMLRRSGVARSELAPRGKVVVRGELWNAEAVEPVAAGGVVEVVGVEGLTLRVRPQTKQTAREGG